MSSPAAPTGRVPRRARLRRAVAVGLAAVVPTLVAGAVVIAPAARADGPTDGSATSLYLVTLAGPGTTGTRSPLPAALEAIVMLGQQSAALESVGSPTPVYRWTTALNGFAVRLDDDQAAALAQDPAVDLVEPDTIQPMAALPSTVGAQWAQGTSTLPVRAGKEARGGAGVVIGFVDSGIDPDNPVFAPVSGAAAPAGFSGDCRAGQGWTEAQCSTKIVGAAWFVEGYGADRVGTDSSLSARDDEGHGTEMASIAAGDAGLSVRVGGADLGTYAGVAPDARVAAYKACWTAPDPADDGCSSADLVSAIDRATADGVDVLNLSVAGTSAVDTVERALLGATEAGILTVAAAGNQPGGVAAHPAPWVLTVGGSAGEVRRGSVRLSSGRAFEGASSATRSVGPARLVLGGDAPARGSSRRQARLCTPGSLDAARVAGRIVLCARGGVGRVSKSQAVAQADGVAMVLTNRGRGSVDADFHAVPTVHLDAAAGRELRRWAAAHPQGRVSLRPQSPRRPARSVVRWSRPGDPLGSVVKPDLLAPAAGLVSASPAALRGAPWDLVSGTSAAAAQVSGEAAVLLAGRPWSADVVRSALMTTTRASTSRGGVLRTGSGVLDPRAADRPGLAFEQSGIDYRRWLTDRSTRLNLPSLVIGSDATTTRRITNLGRHTRSFGVAVTGFTGHDVTVTPAVVRLGPGQSATVLVRVTRLPGARGERGESGYLTWRGGGSTARVPVLVRP